MHGDAFAGSGALRTWHAIIVNGTPYLVELGTGVERQGAATRQKGVLGWGTVALRIGFITHLHSDHTLG